MTKVSVVKYGGTSINSEEKLDAAYQTVSTEIGQRYKTIAVISAFRGVTDLLYNMTLTPAYDDRFISQWSSLHGTCTRHLSEEVKDEFLDRLREKVEFIKASPSTSWIVDDLLAEGESYSSQIFASFLTSKKMKAKVKNFDEPLYPVVSYGEFGNARIDLERTRKYCERSILRDLEMVDCVVMPGIGGVSHRDGRIRVRRGASDYVATSLGYGVHADRLWILSDVHGIQAADSRIIKEAPILPHLTVDELLDAGALGAKNTNTVFFLPLTKYCPKETYFAKYDDLAGGKTRIVEKAAEEGPPVKLVAGREVILYIAEGYDIESQVMALEQKLAQKYDFIRGGGFKKERFFAFFDLNQEPRINKEVAAFRDGMTVTSGRKAIVGVVGEGMKHTKRVIERLGRALGDVNITYVLDISKISAGVVIERKDMEEAIERLYAAFIKEGG